MMPVISFASSKGGAGKTTSAIILATTLARKHTVSVIDADPAQRLMSWAKTSPLPENLSAHSSGGENKIHDEIDAAKENSDYVIIDLEGAATRTNAFAMGESDLVIIPMAMEVPDAQGAIETLAQLSLEARALRREIPVRILFARTPAAVKSRLESDLSRQVREKVGSFNTELNRRTAFSSLHGEGSDLYTMDRSQISGVDKAIQNAELFVEEFHNTMDLIQQIRSNDEPKKEVV